MKKYIIIASMFTLLFTSCIPSLHPIFTPETRITDDRLIGFWIEDSSSILNNSKVSANSNTQWFGKKLNKELELLYGEDFDMSFKENDSVSQNIKKLFVGEDGSSILAKALELELESVLAEKGNHNKKDIIGNYWNFERAARISYKMVDENGLTYLTASNNWEGESEQEHLDKGYTVTKRKSLPYYVLNIKEDAFSLSSDKNQEKVEDRVLVNLTKINDQHYLDFQTIPQNDDSSFSFNRIQGHTFAKVNFSGNNLEIMHLDVEYLEEIIKAKRLRLKHEIIDEDMVLTASTEDLRAFISKYGNDERLFADPAILKTI